MNLENGIKNSSESIMVVKGVNANNQVEYELMTQPLPGLYPGVPKELWDSVATDLDNLPESNETMVLTAGEYVKARIASDNTELYEILEAVKGHYFLAKVPHNVPIDDKEYRLEVCLSKDVRNIPNPDFIVCTPQELSGWMRNS